MFTGLWRAVRAVWRRVRHESWREAPLGWEGADAPAVLTQLGPPAISYGTIFANACQQEVNREPLLPGALISVNNPCEPPLWIPPVRASAEFTAAQGHLLAQVAAQRVQELQRDTAALQARPMYYYSADYAQFAGLEVSPRGSIVQGGPRLCAYCKQPLDGQPVTSYCSHCQPRCSNAPGVWIQRKRSGSDGHYASVAEAKAFHLFRQTVGERKLTVRDALNTWGGCGLMVHTPSGPCRLRQGGIETPYGNCCIQWHSRDWDALTGLILELRADCKATLARLQRDRDEGGNDVIVAMMDGADRRAR